MLFHPKRILRKHSSPLPRRPPPSFSPSLWGASVFPRALCAHRFSEPEPWALKQLTHFSLFELFEILQLPALLLSLAHVSHFFPEREPWAHKQWTQFTVLLPFCTFIVTSSASVFGHRVDVWAPFYSALSAVSSCAPAFGPRVAHCPAFRRILGIFFTFRFVPSVRS